MSAPPDTVVERYDIAGLAVQTLGPAEAPALLLSSGLGGSGGYWTLHLAHLASRFRVILYDQRGAGGSERDLPAPYSLGHMGDDLALILDGLGIESAHVVGHAAGGMAALQLAIDRPAKVRSVTVINGWDAPDPHFVRCMTIRKAIMRTQGARAYLTAQPVFLYPSEWISDHLDELDRQVEAHAPDFQSADVLFARMDALLASDLRGSLGRISCPVLVVVSKDDMLVPARRSWALRDALTSAAVTMAVSDRGGHAVNITEPKWFEGELVAFLSDNLNSQ
jgi:aminoacrylate hydrolase